MCSNKSATSPYLVNNGGFYLVFSIILITNISDFTMKYGRFINSNDSHMQILKTFIVSNIFYMYLRLIGIFKYPWGKPRNSYFIFNKFLINVGWCSKKKSFRNALQIIYHCKGLSKCSILVQKFCRSDYPFKSHLIKFNNFINSIF